MESSDDEGETFPDSVSEYHFTDENDEPLSFSKLSVQWNDSRSLSTNACPIFLNGAVDNGLRKFYQQVKAWKYDFLRDKPEISVLSKDNHWIKLQKPRKSYITWIRTILITVHSLCFFKSKPEATGKSLWDHLSKVFSVYDVRPSENDLINHMNFIREAVKRDETLGTSKFLATLLDNPIKKKSPDENVGAATKVSFIADDTNDEAEDDDFMTKQTEETESETESDTESDTELDVCAICDEGGSLTCCDGYCFRSFHANKSIEDAQLSNCETLCVTPEALEETPQFKCENCQYMLHQCFVCNKLGSSDKSSNTEVFRCSSATCGHFYHPQCVAKLILKVDKAEQQALKEKIAAGDPFICPAHRCAVCKQTENEKVEDLQFATCRRCPTSYHRKCLPRDIVFSDPDGGNDGARAWNGLLPKSRALMYCLKHEIDEDLGTPKRPLIFRNLLSRRSSAPEPLKNKNKMVVKETGGDSIHSSKKKSLIKLQEGFEKSSADKLESSSKKRAAVTSGPESLKRKKVADTSKNPLRRNLSAKAKKPSFSNGQPTLGSRLYDKLTELYDSEKDDAAVDENKSVDENKQIAAAKSLPMDHLPPVDDESKQRIMALMKEAASSVTLDEIKRSYQKKVPSTHAHSSRVDKSIILARVEGSVEALHLALKKLEEGCSVEDAMAVCDPAVIDQLLKWKDKLKVYLAPFLHGMRYTSFGRHFTKVDKLEKIVDKLQWYIEDGDTVVDFCCGANDFSCLVKKRLEEMGKKKCSYKNYDITPPKNDFNFEKRDWMSVSPKELPPGRKLIMGLNPPFGKNAALANQFVNKALRFKPKLIILIVPPETERLDSERKSTRYNLIWEDTELLAGKSFYLPGSVDTSDKQMDQWNNIAPPLYLWSHPDCTNAHKSIAQKHGHVPNVQQLPQSDKNVPASGVLIATNKSEVDLPVVNKVPEPVPNKANVKPGIKKRKKQSPMKKKPIAKEDKSNQNSGKKPIAKEEKSNQNSGKRNRQVQENQEFKTEKQNEKRSRDSSHEDQAQKHDKTSELEAQKLDKTREVQKQEKARVAEIQKDENIPGPSCEVQTQKHDTSELEAQKLDKTREVETQKQEKARVAEIRKDEKNLGPSREVQTQKHEKTRVAETQKDEKTRGPSREVQTQKQEKTWEAETQKEEKTRGPSREVQTQKHEKTREVETQKHEKTRGPSREVQTQKHEKTREVETQKHEKTWVPSREVQTQKHEKTREVETQKHEKTWVPSREVETQRHEKARLPSRERETHKRDSKHSSPHEMQYSDFSFADDLGQPFDQHMESKYSTIIDESNFSLKNDIGQPFDQPGRRYNPVVEEPYYNRRLDVSSNVPTSSYSTRPDPVQYSGYDRVGRGSYYNEMSSRNTSSYSMNHQEPGLTRYGSVDTTVNRSSTSAMQRYAPRLDEMNHTRVNNVGRVEPPSLATRGIGGYGPPLHGPGYPNGNEFSGFAPGPYNPYSHHNSSGGWLNE